MVDRSTHECMRGRSIDRSTHDRMHGRSIDARPHAQSIDRRTTARTVDRSTHDRTHGRSIDARPHARSIDPRMTDGQAFACAVDRPTDKHAHAQSIDGRTTVRMCSRSVAIDGWSWKSESAKCVTTHSPNQVTPKMDGARSTANRPCARWRTPAVDRPTHDRMHERARPHASAIGHAINRRTTARTVDRCTPRGWDCVESFPQTDVRVVH